jgi:hypothetical protein
VVLEIVRTPDLLSYTRSIECLIDSPASSSVGGRG